MDPENTDFTPTPSIPDGPSELPPDPAEMQPAPQAATEPVDDAEKPAPEPAYKYDPRNEIFARRSQLLAEEQAQSTTVFDESRSSGRGLPGSEPVTPDPTALASGDDFVTIKVYGEERRAPRLEVEQAGGVAAYQKAVAADVKLQRASETEARLRAEEQRLLRIAQNLQQGLDANGQPLAQPKPPAPGVPANATNTDVPDSVLDSTVRALYSGDEAQAKAALREVLAHRPAQPNVLSPELVRTVADTVRQDLSQESQLAQAQADVDAANRVFRESFKDIAGDPDMMLWAKGLAGQLAADPEHQGKSRAEIAQLVGERIRAKTGKPVTTDPLQARRKLKDTLPKSAQGQRRAEPPPPQTFPTNKDYIEQLRRNSGSNSTPR